MAINYYKTVLGVAVQIMSMVMLIGIGNDLLSSFYAKMNTGVLNFEELGVMLVFCLTLLMLVNRVPPLVASIITGSSVGSASGIGNFGANAAMGAVMGAATMTAGAASMAGTAVMGGIASAGGGASAVKAAYSKASAACSESGGTDVGNTMGNIAMAATGSESGSVFANMDSGSNQRSASSSFSVGGFSGGATPCARVEIDKAAYFDAEEVIPETRLSANKERDASGFLSRAAIVAAGTVNNLAQGSWDVAKARAGSMCESALDRISDTTGGKVASAIKATQNREDASNAAPASDTNSHDKASIADDEVAAFINRRL